MRSSRSAKADEERRPGWLTAIPYAHRGLHGPGRIENSRAAFEAAVAGGHGIECDVQLTRDGEAVVFHDYGLGRQTDQQGAVADRTLADLQRVKLKGQDEGIPSLTDTLQLVAGRAPLLIEIKARHRSAPPLCAAVLRALTSYPGPAAIMSFNPQAGAWFASRAPQITRGLVVSEHGKRGTCGRVERRLALWRARPDFLAYDIRDLPSRFAAAQRARGLPVLTWTVRSPRDEEAASAFADQIIHELPRP
jgi:glycerophosphoryl diester phosphodiesterase